MKTTLRAVKAVVLVLCLGLLIGRAAVMGQRRATAETSTAATQFLASLTPEQREKANLKFDDANRFDWHYVPRPGAAQGFAVEGNDRCAAAGCAEAAGHRRSARKA